MKYLIVVFLSIALFACSNNEQQSTHDNQSPNESGTVNIDIDELYTTTDPVCKMTVNKSILADTASYKGNIYGFCDPSCKETFLEDPETYISGL